MHAEDLDIEKGDQLFAVLEKMDRRSQQIDRELAWELARDEPDKKALDALSVRNKSWLSRMRRLNGLIDKCLG